MLIAIVHYHLDPGGVSTVIRGASEALIAAGVAHVILTGGSSDHPQQRVVPALGYFTRTTHPAGRLVADLRRTATEALGGPPDVWHFHNHSLGKNTLLPAVISELAAAGDRIVLQIHDLAEQGRPQNYQVIADQLEIYPVSPRIHFAFLNRRDLAIFTDAGLPVENATLLPNPVSSTPLSTIRSLRPPLLFAPIRGIRRKNLGELVLLAALAPTGTRVAVSRAPGNPDALPIHDTWRQFAEKHQLPISFDVVDRLAPEAGAGCDFASWIAHASHFVTTSVSEGFGMPFLESIAHGKPLLGRDSPHLTEEHAAQGISHTALYRNILVPADWVDYRVLENHLTTTLEKNFRLYRRELLPGHIAATMESLLHGDRLDFGNLPEILQQEVIEKLIRDSSKVTADGHRPQLQDQIVATVCDHHGSIPLPLWLEETLAIRTPSAPPASLAPWSLEKYQSALVQLYQNLTTQPAAPLHHLHAGKILSAHLAPDSFHFLLSASEIKFRAVIFDIYGTLLIASAGGVKPDLLMDPVLRDVLRQHGHEPPDSPSTDLHAAVLRHHAAAGVDYPEIDLRVLWREILTLPSDHDTTALVQALENAWHPAIPMPGSEKFVRNLATRGISLGLLSNAQSNTLADLGPIADLFAPELTILSYQHRIAKPAAQLFKILTDRLADLGIFPAETLYIGNDPLHDIVPAGAAGFKTALFVGDAESLRDGESTPDFTFHDWNELESHYFGTADRSCVTDFESI